jgi:hypothetical protein
MSTALPPQAKIGLSFDLPVFKQKLSEAGRPDLAALLTRPGLISIEMVFIVLNAAHAEMH